MTFESTIELAKKKYFKESNLIFELTLTDYQRHSYYIRLDLINEDAYISWFIFDNIKNFKKLDKYISKTYVSINMVLHLIDILQSYELIPFSSIKTPDSQVSIRYVKDTKIKEHISFYRYIPKEISYISECFALLFNELPYNMDPILYELNGIILNVKEVLDAKETFFFDLKKNKIESLYKSDALVRRGEEFIENGKVRYLEKIRGRYFAIVEDDKSYVVMVEYDEDKKVLQMDCNCDYKYHCKHEYAVLKSIKENNFKKFFKVSFKDPTKNIIDEITSFNYLLCLGTFEDKLIVLYNNKDIITVPILNEEHKSKWYIIEDDENETLKNAIERIEKR